MQLPRSVPSVMISHSFPHFSLFIVGQRSIIQSSETRSMNRKQVKAEESVFFLVLLLIVILGQCCDVISSEHNAALKQKMKNKNHAKNRLFISLYFSITVPLNALGRVPKSDETCYCPCRVILAWEEGGVEREGRRERKVCDKEWEEVRSGVSR